MLPIPLEEFFSFPPIVSRRALPSPTSEVKQTVYMKYRYVAEYTLPTKFHWRYKQFVLSSGTCRYRYIRAEFSTKCCSGLDMLLPTIKWPKTYNMLLHCNAFSFRSTTAWKRVSCSRWGHLKSRTAVIRKINVTNDRAISRYIRKSRGTFMSQTFVKFIKRYKHYR